jgi:hypothetical protein
LQGFITIELTTEGLKVKLFIEGKFVIEGVFITRVQCTLSILTPCLCLNLTNGSHGLSIARAHHALLFYTLWASHP